MTERCDHHYTAAALYSGAHLLSIKIAAPEAYRKRTGNNRGAHIEACAFEPKKCEPQTETEGEDARPEPWPERSVMSASGASVECAHR